MLKFPHCSPTAFSNGYLQLFLITALKMTISWMKSKVTMLEWEKSLIQVFISILNPIAKFSIVCTQLALRKGMANYLYLVAFLFILNFFSILELFGTPGGYNFPEDFFRDLTQQDILNAINTRNLSGVFLSERNYASLLGGVQRNESGHIIGAKSTYIAWFTELDINGEKDSGRDLGLDDNADEGTLEFELELRKILESQCDLPEGLYSYANVHRSFGDISTKAIWDDVTYMVIGYMMLYAFVQIMIGRFNKVEQRVRINFSNIIE